MLTTLSFELGSTGSESVDEFVTSGFSPDVKEDKQLIIDLLIISKLWTIIP